MKLQATGKKILILPIKQPAEQIKDGIILPESAAKTEAMEAKVVSVGLSAPEVIKPGQTILANRYTGQRVKIDGVEHHLVTEDDIFGIIS